MESRTSSLADRLSRLEAGGGWRTFVHRAYLAVHRAAEKAGLHVVRASYDSPIPRSAELDASVFERESPLRAIAWDSEAQMRWVEGELGPFLAEFHPPEGGDGPPGEFRFDNQTYDRVDADLLYAIVRLRKPHRVVELGSGYSTLLIADALEANRREGRDGTLAVFDPYPSPHVIARADLAPRLQRVGARDVDESVVSALEAGDVLFVDTSHTVKQGGDVNRILLDLLPLVAPGVAVHFHDVFLPGDYSRGHLAAAHYWNEQYLIQAFLMYNDAWEVLVGAQALARAFPHRLATAVASYRQGVSPGALWLSRREAEG